MMNQDKVAVYARLRPSCPQDDSPAFEGEAPSSSTFLTPDGEGGDRSCFDMVDVDAGELVYRPSRNASEAKSFKLAGVFDSDASQDGVYDHSARHVIDGVLQGYNGAILAYGQTGSGKTHTMRGPEACAWPGAECGVVPRALAHLLEEREKCKKRNVEVSLSLSYLQIYCEIIQDLLEPANANMSVRQNTDGHVYVEGLSKTPITSLNQCLEVLQRGDSHRTVASTRLNASSSRSHAAIIVHMERREILTPSQPRASDAGTEQGVLLTSTLTMVDLAGSERVKRSGVQYQQFEESKAINLSLSSLGNCVAALAHGHTHIPFRDSKLTRLLSQSLGGNARTSVIVTLCPGNDATGENLSTLQFAQRASRLKVSAVRNEAVDFRAMYQQAQNNLDKKDDHIHELELQVAALNEKLSLAEKQREEAMEAQQRAESKLIGAESAFSASLAAAQQASDNADGQQAVAAIESVNTKWRQELEVLEKNHEGQLDELRERLEKKIDAYKTAASAATQECHSLESERTQERQEYLTSLEKYRACREQLATTEKETAARISELLSEVSAKEDRETELREALENAKRTADMSLSKASDMAQRVESLEAVHREQADQISRDYVSREHVASMERLFKETVDRLATRLEELEQRKQRNDRMEKVDRSRMDEGSRKILEDLENQSAGWMRPGPSASTGGVRRGVALEGPRGKGARGVRIEPGRLRAKGAASERRF